MGKRDALRGLSAFCFATAFGMWVGLVSPDLDENNFLTQALSGAIMSPEIQEAPLPETPRETRVPIVVYHSVRPHIKGESEYQDVYDITPELLEKQLEYLRENNFTTITFKMLADYFDNKISLPKKPVILSFDDSWHNQYEYAFPVLKEFNATGTFFVFTNSLNHGNHMTLSEVKELRDAGMEIGSHTKTHPYLDEVVDPDALKNEVANSKEILRLDLGVMIDTFAYPFGEHASSSIEAVKRAGYRTGRTLQKGTLQKESERYTLPAFLTTDDIRDFIRMVNQ